MIWIHGRFSWPLILAVAYATVVIVATDVVWRMVQAPIMLVAGGGLAVLAVGVALILLLGVRSKKGRSA